MGPDGGAWNLGTVWPLGRPAGSYASHSTSRVRAGRPRPERVWGGCPREDLRQQHCVPSRQRHHGYWAVGGRGGGGLLGGSLAPHGPPSPHSVPLLASVAGGSLLQSSAPVNIPGSLGSSASFHSASPSPPVSLSSHFLQQPQGHLSQSENTFLGTSASHGSLGKSQYGSLRPGAGIWAFGKCLWAFCPGWRQYRVEVRAGDLGSEVSQAPYPQCSELCEPGQVT